MVIFLHPGWGKVATAGAVQYAIDRWQPRLMINIGTCGGLESRVKLNETVLAEETLIYDIIESMSSYEQAINAYSCKANLAWLGDTLPFSVRRARLLSADRDIRSEDVKMLTDDFDGIAADWESGAFAWVATRNAIDWLVLRGVSDIIGTTHNETFGNVSLWQERTQPIMKRLLGHLPWLINRYKATH